MQEKFKADVSDDNALDISNESYRSYVYSDGTTYTITKPKRLFVKRSDKGDSHRVISQLKSHYVAPGWIAIEWVANDGVGMNF